MASKVGIGAARTSSTTMTDETAAPARMSHDRIPRRTSARAIATGTAAMVRQADLVSRSPLGASTSMESSSTSAVARSSAERRTSGSGRTASLTSSGRP
jgi:hypothetical protein